MEVDTASRSCPEDNTLTALIERALPRDQVSRIGHHIDRCDRCRKLLAVMARSSAATTRLGKRLRFARGTRPPLPQEQRANLLAPGTSVARFRVRRLIGTGGMGVVYEAFDPQLDRRVALKLIRPELLAIGPELEARLLRESQAQARLSHPNVVPVYDCGSYQRQLFVAMEYVDGTTLTQWLRERQRTLHQIVEVFLGAGRGLQAAHEAGLVHRDFKPDNVLIGRDGRVCVADFGLARAVDAPVDTTRGRTSTPSAVPVTSTITRTGALVGTPAYMAPEQHARRPTDARTDEFSFCVALHEAIYGERPYAGSTPEEIAAAVARGEVRRPTKNLRVPPRLRRVLLRGLRPAPEDRYPSMRALLRAVARSGRSRRGPAAVAAGLAVVAGFAVMALARDGSPASTCSDSRDRLAGVWDADRKTAVRASLTASGIPQAVKRWQYVERRLDAHAEGWTTMRREVCRATQNQEQSAEMLDVRMHCLDTELDRLRQITSLLASGDPAVSESALDSLRGLPRLERCAAAEVLEARVPQPADQTTRTAVAELRREIVRAQVLSDAGRYRDALAVLTPLEPRTIELGYRPVEAEVLYYLGYIRSQTEAPQVAEKTLRRAAHAAEAGRHDEIAAESWTYLVLVAAQDLGDLDKAHDYADQASAAIERLGGDREIGARLELNLGQVYLLESKLDLAQASFRRAAEQSSDDQRLEALSRSGMTYEDQGRFDEALAAHEYVLGERVKRLGPDHPDVALSHSRIAAVLFQMGRFDEAIGHAETSLAVSEVTAGPDHLDTARARHDLAEMLSAMGRHQEALDLHVRALAVTERVLGSDHPDVANMLVSQGELLVRIGRADDAVAVTRRALHIYEGEGSQRGFDVARCLINLGDALREAGAHDEALVIARRGLAALEAALGPDTPFSGYGWTGVGRSLLDAGKPVRAIAPLEKALACYQSAEVDPGQIAVTRFALARALWESGGDRARARALAKQARDVFESAGPGRAWELEQFDAWQRSRS